MTEFFNAKAARDGALGLRYLAEGNTSMASVAFRSAWRYALRASGRPIPKRVIGPPAVRTRRVRPLVKLSTYERHQLAADAGYDTWEDYRGEK